MPTIRVTSRTPAAEVRKKLRRAMSTDPQKEWGNLRRRLQKFERQFGLSSEEFWARYEQGEMGDEAEIMSWAMHYRAFLRLSEKVAPQEEPVARKKQAA